MERNAAQLKTLDEYFKKNVHNYSFHQILFLMEKLNCELKEFGNGTSIHQESAKLTAHCTLSSPFSDCLEIHKTSMQHELKLNNISLIGVNGILPRNVTEKILAENKFNSKSTLLEFLNIMHHRFFSLMHKVEKNKNISICTESEYNKYFIEAISGSTNHKMKWLQPFAGILWQKQKNKQTLKIVIETMFNVQVEIQQFVKQLVKIENRYQAKTSKKLNKLILGKKAKCISKKIKIIIKISDIQIYNSMLPGMKNFNMLKDICEYYLKPNYNFLFEMQLEPSQKPYMKLYSGNKLGLNTWLGHRHNHSGYIIN